MSNGGWTDARELAVPKKLIFYRNAVGGATDCIHDKRGWERRVKDISQGWEIPD